MDQKDQKIKTFALERISLLEITERKFDYPDSFNTEEIFKHSFGIVSPNADAPEEIILSFTPTQGRYVTSLPLHASQKIILENDQELQVLLTLFVTHDLMMELLSYGDQVEVLKPDSLREEIKNYTKVLMININKTLPFDFIIPTDLGVLSFYIFKIRHIPGS